jgi:hypothetical protein
VTTTTWNPADKDASITLSGGNLIATASVSGYQGVRAIASHSSGKYYSEDTYNSNPSGELIISGFANAAYNVASGGFVGQSNNGVGYDGDAGLIWKNNVNTAVQTAVSGDVVGYAIDLDNSKFWVRTIHLGTPGNWNNSGTDNPATNTGGFSFAGLAAGPYFPAASINVNLTNITTNFGATAFAAAAPSGFGNW